MRPQVTIDNKYVLMNRVLYDDDSVYAAILRTSVSGFDWKKKRTSRVGNRNVWDLPMT